MRLPVSATSLVFTYTPHQPSSSFPLPLLGMSASSATPATWQETYCLLAELE